MESDVLQIKLQYHRGNTDIRKGTHIKNISLDLNGQGQNTIAGRIQEQCGTHGTDQHDMDKRHEEINWKYVDPQSKEQGRLEEMY